MIARSSLISLFASLVHGHGYVKTFTIDGTVYPGWGPADAMAPGAKRIEWSFPQQNTLGFGPVLDVTSPDIACRKAANPPALTAPLRAGAEVKFQWTNYFTSHKGPVLTYMGRFEKGMKPQDVEFFKIDEGTYDPKTGIWASDVLIRNNNTWTVQTPSDIKPGTYILRHELIALHFGGTGNPNGAGTASSGAQLYPVCVNIQVTGNGDKTPPGIKFPGAYTPKDPGILDNIYFGANRYVSPGGSVYEGAHDKPTGQPPVVKETGKGTGAPAAMVSAYDGVFHSIVSGVNEALPGGGGYKTAADGNPGLNQPVNGGKSAAPVGNLLKGGLLPSGVIPGKGYVPGSGTPGPGGFSGPAGPKGLKLRRRQLTARQIRARQATDPAAAPTAPKTPAAAPKTPATAPKAPVKGAGGATPKSSQSTPMKPAGGAPGGAPAKAPSEFSAAAKGLPNYSGAQGKDLKKPADGYGAAGGKFTGSWIPSQ